MKSPKSSAFLFPEVRVVEASAGSGKTYALAKRYVQLLLNPALSHDDVPMRDILAITFTNKAAFEMKSRILDFLKRVALGRFSADEEKEILKPIGLTRDTAQSLAFAAMESLIHNYNFFQVQTIDSFIKSLLSGCAFKVGLSAGFRISRNSRDYLAFSLDALIDQASRDPAARKLFEQFLGQYLFLENKPGWFPKKDMLELLLALYREGNTYGGDFICHDLRGDDLAAKKKRILEAMRQLDADMPGGVDARFQKSLHEFLEKYKQAFDTDRIPTGFNRDEIPVRKGTEVPGAISRLWKRIREELKDLCEAEAYSLFNPYLAIFGQAENIFKEKVVEDDVLFLESLNRQARILFAAGAVTVEELYYRLATRFHHYLIDEFQDTSRLQWLNLVPLVDEALSTGGSFFYVGDKKQAIYRFRGGDARLFDEILTNFKVTNIQRELLAKNYRSCQAVVDFNNKIFSVENLKRFVLAKAAKEEGNRKGDLVYLGPEDFKEIVDVFGASEQTTRAGHDGGYVRVERIDAENKEERDEVLRERTLTLIDELKTRFPLSAIAVLTRSNEEVRQVTSWLLEAGLPVESERTMNIQDHPLVSDLIAFLTFLNSPIDNLAFARFLSGDIFLKASGLSTKEIQDFLFRLRPQLTGDKAFYIYKAFRDTYPAIWEQFLDEFFKNVGLYPLYELALSIVYRLGVLTNFSDQQGFVMRFLELIKEQEEETSDVSTFLENLEQLPEDEFFVHVTEAESIKVTTIHKVKGLEFPVVILPFLGMRVQVGSGGGLGQLSYLMDARDDQLRLLRIKEKYLQFSDELAAIWKQEYRQAFLTELNSIYVALTRAAEEMYIFLPNKIASSFNLVNFLVPDDLVELGTRRTKLAKAKAEVAARMILPVAQTQDWLEFLREEFKEEAPIANREAVREGEALHFLLAQAVNLVGTEMEAIVRTALAKAKARFVWMTDSAVYDEKMRGILTAAVFQPFFCVTGGEIFVEQEIISASGQTRRIDRLIVTKKEVWVVDYKSSRDERAAAIPQMGEYVTLVSALYPGRRVRVFLLYLNELANEEIKCDSEA